MFQAYRSSKRPQDLSKSLKQLINLPQLLQKPLRYTFMATEKPKTSSTSNFDTNFRISSQELEKVPSPFVADKSKSLFAKYSTPATHPYGIVEVTIAQKIPLTRDTYLFRLKFKEEDKD